MYNSKTAAGLQKVSAEIFEKLFTKRRRPLLVQKRRDLHPITGHGDLEEIRLARFPLVFPQHAGGRPVAPVQAQRLEQIRDAVNAALDPDGGARVAYYKPDDFIAWLNSLPAAAAVRVSNEPTVTIRRGRKVTRKAPSLTPEERRQKEAERIALIAEVMGKRLR